MSRPHNTEVIVETTSPLEGNTLNREDGMMMWTEWVEVINEEGVRGNASLISWARDGVLAGLNGDTHTHAGRMG